MNFCIAKASQDAIMTARQRKKKKHNRILATLFMVEKFWEETIITLTTENIKADGPITDAPSALRLSLPCRRMQTASPWEFSTTGSLPTTSVSKDIFSKRYPTNSACHTRGTMEHTANLWNIPRNNALSDWKPAF